MLFWRESLLTAFMNHKFSTTPQPLLTFPISFQWAPAILWFLTHTYTNYFPQFNTLLKPFHPFSSELNATLPGSARWTL